MAETLDAHEVRHHMLRGSGADGCSAFMWVGAERAMPLDPLEMVCVRSGRVVVAFSYRAVAKHNVWSRDSSLAYALVTYACGVVTLGGGRVCV